jgi:hypothetical protein
LAEVQAEEDTGEADGERSRTGGQQEDARRGGSQVPDLDG